MEDLRLDALPGVGPVTTKKLSDAGIHNIMDLIVRGPVELAEITGMDKDTAANIVEKARQCLVEGGMISKDFVSATEIYKRRQEIGKITTGTECLDFFKFSFMLSSLSSCKPFHSTKWDTSQSSG